MDVLKYLLTAALLVGCDVQHAANPEVFYKRDAVIKYAGKRFVGVAILPKAAKYDLEFNFAGDLALFSLRTCHREITQEEFGTGGIFDRKKNYVQFQYEPQPSIEAGTYCPVEVGGFDETGRHGWGFIDFEDDNNKLGALVQCNGFRQIYNGVSVCQSSEGLLQRITFATPVRFSPSECLSPETDDNKTFTIPAPTGRCVYVFKELEGEKRFHRLTLIGYQSILVRKSI